MKLKTLEELGDFKNGVNFKSEKMGSGIPLINVKDITDSPLLKIENLALVDLNVDESYYAKENDIFFVRSSVKLDGIGLVGQIKNNEKQAIHCGFVIRFRPTSDEVDSTFLTYLLRSHHYRERLKGLSGGAAIINISQGSLKSLEVKLPSLLIQQKIAEILSAYDELIENNLKRIVLLEKSVRLLYDEWFVHLRFPGHEHTSIVDGIPENWKKGIVQDILELQRGFDLPTQSRDSEGIVPVFASTGIVGHHSKAKVAGPGVVTGRSGTIGKVSYIEPDFWPLNTSLWVKKYYVGGPLFAFQFLQTLSLEQFAGGAAVPSLDRKIVHAISVAVPSLNLVRDFESTVKPIQKQIGKLQLQNQKLKQARDILLSKLINGEITV